MVNIEAPRAEPMKRVNTRIREDQQMYIRTLAKLKNISEGVVFREIIDKHIEINKIDLDI